ncbi:MAG: AAA-like domain-containing protein, partial [Desulfococcaceae bacterium]|nr:AAA-like domain-containing protein [Desulfococcaceae bacterium]
MRKFFSYGPVDRDMHFYAPREELIAEAWNHVVGENPDKGGHYITVWAPRQAGKSWIMQQILWKLQKDDRFDVLKLNLESLIQVKDTNEIIKYIAEDIIRSLELENIHVDTAKEFAELFRNDVLKKPLVLIMDEFDALSEEAISTVAKIFRNIHNFRRDDPNPSAEKKYLLHGVALIGVRSVLGIENVKGSPFNVQRSLHIPNLTFEEVEEMFRWYERESGQKVEQEVIER